uniref:Interleukin 23, alpha subunit p19 n=1 Tax=Astyanax mexicanus TaxID=7994 RepID=A0A3B1JGW8_ASTMX
MGSSRCLALFSALLALLMMCAHGAPAGARIQTQLDYSAGESLALKLNSEARHLYREVSPCLMRVALALKNYSRIFGDAGLFKEGCTKCSKWKSNAVTVVEVTRKLLDELKPLNPADWMIEGLLRDSVDRLYSFSIITARIFSFLSHQHQQTGNSVNDNLL